MPKYSQLLIKNIEKRLQDLERKPAWLAQKAQMSPGTLYRILNEERSPNLDTLEMIEKGLGLTPGELLKPIPKSTDLDTIAIITGILPTLNKSQLQIVSDLARSFVASTKPGTEGGAVG